VGVGPVVDVAGREAMTAVVAGEEYDRQARDLADAQRRRRLAPRARDALFAHALETRQIVDARSPDHPEHRFAHGVVSLSPDCRSKLPVFGGMLQKRRAPDGGASAANPKFAPQLLRVRLRTSASKRH